MRTVAYAFISTILLAAPALAQPGETCIRPPDVRTYTSPNDRTVIFETYRNGRYTAKLIGTCHDIDFGNPRVKSRGVGLAHCLTVGDEFITRSTGMGRGVCSIVSIRPYEPGDERRRSEDSDSDRNSDGDRHGDSY